VQSQITAENDPNPWNSLFGALGPRRHSRAAQGPACERFQIVSSVKINFMARYRPLVVRWDGVLGEDFLKIFLRWALSEALPICMNLNTIDEL